MYRIDLRVLNDDTQQHKDYTVFVSPAAFELQSTPSFGSQFTPAVIPWDEWGRLHTRWFENDFDDPPIQYGSRALVPSRDVVLNFNALDNARDVHRETMNGSDSKGWHTVGKDSPTILNARGLLNEDVVSHLPYRWRHYSLKPDNLADMLHPGEDWIVF